MINALVGWATIIRQRASLVWCLDSQRNALVYIGSSVAFGCRGSLILASMCRAERWVSLRGRIQSRTPAPLKESAPIGLTELAWDSCGILYGPAGLSFSRCDLGCGAHPTGFDGAAHIRMAVFFQSIAIDFPLRRGPNKRLSN